MTLGQSQPFRLGPLLVEPAGCRVVAVDRREERLEPRVMQVLVVLVEAAGAVVSRDQLIDRCWDGRIVSDDAINRVIGRLRRVSEGLGDGAFHIETIPKVGYRLVAPTGAAAAMEAIPAPDVSPAPPSQPRPALRRYAPLLAVAGAGLAAAWLWLQPAAGSRLQIEPPAVIGPAPAAAIAQLRLELADAVTCHCVESEAVPGQGSRRQYRLATAWQATPGGATVHAELRVPGASAPVWRRRFALAGTGNAAIAGLARSLADTAGCVIAGHREGLAGQALAYWADFCDGPAPDRGEAGYQADRLQRLVGIAPRSALGWAALAQMQTETLPSDDPQWRARALLPARAAAERALALEPGSGEAMLAMANTRDPDDLVGQHKWLEAAMATPARAGAVQALAFLMGATGQMREAVRLAKLSTALEPLNPVNRSILANSLRAAGQFGEAEQLAASLDGPGQPARLQISLAITRRDWKGAIAAAADLPDDGYRRALLPVLHALARGEAATPAAIADLARQRQPGAWVARPLAAAGQPQLALALLDRALGIGQAPGVMTALFEPGMEAVRRLPGFADLLQRRGLIRYWQTRHVRPDLCLDPAAPPFCARLTV